MGQDSIGDGEEAEDVGVKVLFEKVDAVGAGEGRAREWGW